MKKLFSIYNANYLFLFIACFGLVYSTYIFIYDCRKRCIIDQVTEGTITKISDKDYKGSIGSIEYLYKFENKTYSNIDPIRLNDYSNLQVGKTISVFFAPKDPTISYSEYHAQKDLIKDVVLYLFGLFCSFSSLYLYLHFRKKIRFVRSLETKPE